MNTRPIIGAILILGLSGCATSPMTTTSIPEVRPLNVTYISSVGTFAWPVRGEIISPFDSQVGKVKNKGIDISSAEGLPVRAAKDGRVVYCDPQLKGYGKTIILDHGNRFETVYSYNSEILVKVGDTVRRNDIIARVGHTGRAKGPGLHFEIRRDGEPQNPMHYLSR